MLATSSVSGAAAEGTSGLRNFNPRYVVLRSIGQFVWSAERRLGETPSMSATRRGGARRSAENCALTVPQVFTDVPTPSPAGAWLRAFVPWRADCARPAI